MRLLRIIFVLCLFSSISKAFGDTAAHDEYLSIYSDEPKALGRVPLSTSGVPLFDQKVVDHIADSFTELYDPSNPVTRCALLNEQEPGWYCSSPGKSPDGLVGFQFKHGLFWDRGNRFRVFVPPGTTEMSVTAHFNLGTKGAVIAFAQGQPPRQDQMAFSSNDPLTAYAELRDMTGTPAYLMRKVEGEINFLQLSATGDAKLEPSQTGEWLYIDFPCLTASQAFGVIGLVDVYMSVDWEIYEKWFADVTAGTDPDWKWDTNGDPELVSPLYADYSPPVTCPAPAYYPPRWLIGQTDILAEDTPLDHSSGITEMGVSVYNWATKELLLPTVLRVDDDAVMMGLASMSNEGVTGIYQDIWLDLREPKFTNCEDNGGELSCQVVATKEESPSLPVYSFKNRKLFLPEIVIVNDEALKLDEVSAASTDTAGTVRLDNVWLEIPEPQLISDACDRIGDGSKVCE